MCTLTDMTKLCLYSISVWLGSSNPYWNASCKFHTVWEIQLILTQTKIPLNATALEKAQILTPSDRQLNAQPVCNPAVPYFANGGQCASTLTCNAVAEAAG